MKIFGFLRREPTCRAVAEVLQRYLDGEASPRKAAKVAAHLDRCGGCCFEAEILTDIKEALGRLRTEVDTDTLDRLERFVASLKQRAASP